MNKAVDCEHFGAVLEICRNPIELFMAAACSSMLDIVKAPIKFGAPLDALIEPMLAALAANPAHTLVAGVTLRTITFKIAPPVLNFIEICEILFSTFEAADGCEGEAPFLLVWIIWMAADAV
jgi:hypothetical protein